MRSASICAIVWLSHIIFQQSNISDDDAIRHRYSPVVPKLKGFFPFQKMSNHKITSFTVFFLFIQSLVNQMPFFCLNSLTESHLPPHNLSCSYHSCTTCCHISTCGRSPVRSNYKFKKKKQQCFGRCWNGYFRINTSQKVTFAPRTASWRSVFGTSRPSSIRSSIRLFEGPSPRPPGSCRRRRSHTAIWFRIEIIHKFPKKLSGLVDDLPRARGSILTVIVKFLE